MGEGRIGDGRLWCFCFLFFIYPVSPEGFLTPPLPFLVVAAESFDLPSGVRTGLSGSGWEGGEGRRLS